jgi:S1-C subfamily serine protease
VPAAIVTTLAVVAAAAVGVHLGGAAWRTGTPVSPYAAGGGASAPADAPNGAGPVDAALVDVNSTFAYQNAEGAGTGIVLTSTGEVLTNNHVINGATAISVTDIGNGRTYAATVVGYDNAHDVAVLRLQGAAGLATADIGDSSKVAVGDAVAAVGNAGGTGGTPVSASGSVTALNRSIIADDELDGVSERLSGLIEVDANVQSGDSGGSLVNASGQVIGIDTAGSASYSIQRQNGGGAEGFAIPIDTALSIARQIATDRPSSTVHVGATAFLGVMVSASDSRGTGAVVADVVPGGPADQAGVAPGEVITSLDGRAVGSGSNLSAIIGALKPGQSVVIGYADDYGRPYTATVRLSAGPPA